MLLPLLYFAFPRIAVVIESLVAPFEFQILFYFCHQNCDASCSESINYLCVTSRSIVILIRPILSIYQHKIYFHLQFSSNSFIFFFCSFTEKSFFLSKSIPKYFSTLKLLEMGLISYFLFA